MKLHASVCFFNGEEFLESCVRNLEGIVDYVTVVWQEKSYRGNPISEEARQVLTKLNVNQVHYENDNDLSEHENETAKRNLALNVARSFSATHHMDMDVDEFYFHSQLKQIKELMEKDDLDSMACRLYEYHSDIHWRCKEWRSDLFVGLINKIHSDTRFVFRGDYPVLIDPTRRVNTYKNFYACGPQEICMHHYTLIRKHMYKSKIIDCNGGKNNMDRLQVLSGGSEADYKIVPDYFDITSLR